MTTGLSAIYGIVKLLKRLGKKIIKRIEKWIGDMYRARDRWNRIQPTLQNVHHLVPAYIIKIKRLQRLGNNWAIENQNIRADFHTMRENASRNLKDVSKHNLQLVDENIKLTEEVTTLNQAMGFKLSSFYEMVNRLPKEMRVAFLEVIGMTMKELKQLKPEEVPNCFRQYGSKIICKNNFIIPFFLSMARCRFAQRCDMRKAHDEKLALKEQTSQPIAIVNKHESKPIINPNTIPIASPIINKEGSET